MQGNGWGIGGMRQAIAILSYQSYVIRGTATPHAATAVKGGIARLVPSPFPIHVKLVHKDFSAIPRQHHITRRATEGCLHVWLPITLLFYNRPMRDIPIYSLKVTWSTIYPQCQVCDEDMVASCNCN